jgi:hypothetical protein
MLLRRFILNFRKQEWAAILVELVIVVGGVFIGLQAANWNDDRLEQEKGRLIAERLISDLRNDLESRRTVTEKGSLHAHRSI